MSKIRRQYGLWDSPISPTVLGRSISFADLAWDESGGLLWLERRSGRGMVVLQPPDGQARRDLNSEYDVRGRVGYGGGDFTTGRGRVYFAEVSSGRLYCQEIDGGRARPVTPGFGASASPCLSPNGRWLLFVHTYEGCDVLAVVDAEGESWPAVLARGADFYMQPCWHPNSRNIAWIAWNHPNMPWDGTRLYLGSLAFPRKGLPVMEHTTILAGDESISIFQPQFSPNGRYLAYVSDQTGWWQIYLYDLKTDQHRQLTCAEAEHGVPAWVQGTRTYGFAPDGQRLFFLRNAKGRVSLWEYDFASDEEHPIALEGYSNLSQIAVAPDGQRVALLADGGRVPLRLITSDWSGEVHVWARSTPEDLLPSVYSQPQHTAWQGIDGGEVYGLYYPPNNPDFEGIGLPPLIVMIHGGPTSQRFAAFYLGVQFFTSRGYAVLDVNYRGSTGYGREYRDRLRGNWGVYDVQDAISGARTLAEEGQVDDSRLVIMGGSAGGFTVLKALEDYPGFFKAGICLYGVSNQFTLAAETHKFEARYLDTLLGPLPQAAEVYRQRSPIFFVDQIKDPLLIFQGEEDVVVPRTQSDQVVASLQRRGVPTEYHLYAGEGHGFRKAETIEHMYSTVEKFLRQYVIFA